MIKKLLNKTINPIILIDFIVMMVMGVVTVLFKKPYMYFGIAFILLAIAVRLFHLMYSEKTARKAISKITVDLQQQLDEMSKSFANDSPILICLVDKNGRLAWSNDKFAEVFESQEMFDEQVGSRFINLFFDKDATCEEIMIGDKHYTVNASVIQRHDGSMARMLFWQDVTERETLRQLYSESRACQVIVDIDNYDELISSAPTEEQSTIAAEIDRAIHNWALQMNAAIAKVKASRYSLTLEAKYINQLTKEKFPILDTMHEIQTKAEFPTTVSIGIGVGDAELTELQEFAEEAIDLALARGGDQAVIRTKGGDTRYFGGTLPAVEKRNKGRSRVIAHQLLSAIEASDKVIIMGHSNPDLDAFGAALGLYMLCKNIGKPAAVVLNEPSEGIEEAYKHIAKNEEYKIISHEVALANVSPSTLLIVADHHIQAISECPELIDKASRIALIDHHRKSANAIENTMLTHMEVYASSTSELVTEILQYSGGKGQINKQVAELLLAGITLDTKNFTTNAGARTFDAAAFRKKYGADNKVIKNYFKMRLELYQKKAAIIASAEILSNGVAVAYTRDSDKAMQVICAQAADELLDMIGVEAAFVAGRAEDFTTVSARSSSTINVQVIMEQLGGGGHQNVAAAQVDTSPEEAIAQIVNIMRKEEIL
ncbi:MAG: DHH family phosphoesterase [Clostridia bacterium]|nr:DHH family phosphoesterase [Clostridia bacterium]